MRCTGFPISYFAFSHSTELRKAFFSLHFMAFRHTPQHAPFYGTSDFQPPIWIGRFEFFELKELWHTIDDGICLLFRLHPSRLDTHRRLLRALCEQLHETLGGQTRTLTKTHAEIFIT